MSSVSISNLINPSYEEVLMIGMPRSFDEAMKMAFDKHNEIVPNKQSYASILTKAKSDFSFYQDD